MRCGSPVVPSLVVLILACGKGASINLDGGADGLDHDASAVTCGQDPWPTYGHDPQRTSASNGCVSGPLSLAWSAAGLPGDVDHMIATSDAIYTSSQTAVLDKVSSAGLEQWERAVGKDFYTRQWNTSAFGKVVVEDDQLAFVDEAQPANQTKIVFDVDDWGENTADADRFYVNCDVNSPDGPGLYVGAYDKTGTALWTADSHKQCDRVSELDGSIAVDGGTVFRGAIFVGPNDPLPFSSGVKAFDATTGVSKWDQATMPASAISAGTGNVYLVESVGGTNLVARAQSNGDVVWSTPITGTTASVQAPVLAAGLVIVATESDVRAFDAATGALTWTASDVQARADVFSQTGSFDNCPAADAAAQFATFPDTTLAAALGSSTLVVTAQDALHVLSLSTGADLEHGPIANVHGPLKNPIIVGDTVYVIDTGASKLVGLTSP